MPASFFIFGCVSSKSLRPIPQLKISLFTVKPDGLHRKGVVTPFSEDMKYIAISPEDFGELLNRCPIE
jgi:hypothetical protein